MDYIAGVDDVPDCDVIDLGRNGYGELLADFLIKNNTTTSRWYQGPSGNGINHRTIFRCKDVSRDFINTANATAKLDRGNGTV